MALKRSAKKHKPIEVSTDRLSYLPQRVLLHILSFLPTETVVQTCVLSTRWRYLWTSLPALDFSSHRFNYPNKVRKTNFVDFVDKILMLRDGSDLNKMRLSYYDKHCDPCRADTWIRSALSRNVIELDLDICLERGFEFPHYAYTSKSLAKLKLELYFWVLKLPSGVGFCSLKTLYLSQVSLMDKNQNLELFSKCPLLEDLHIVHFEAKNLNIFALKLKNLLIEHSSGPIKIKVFAPNLLLFKYKGDIPEECDLENLSSLVKAVLKISAYGFQENPICMRKIIQGVSKAQVLTLSSSCIQHLSEAPNISEFLPTSTCNLKRLKLTTALDHIQVIASLLKQYINLETLVVDIKELGSNTLKNLWHESFPFECPLDHLKEVEIRDFQGSEYEFQFVKFLVMNAKVMKRMIILPLLRVKCEQI